MSTAVRPADLIANQLRDCAQVIGALKECDSEIQEIVWEMFDVMNDVEATDDEKTAAIHTIIEALFPSLTHDLGEIERSIRTQDDDGTLEQMEAEEKHFADRVNELMAQHELTQAELAEKVGVGQSAIANMLSRKSRPQRKTVARFAEAFGVDAYELMP